MKPSGLIREAFSFSDYCFEKIFGSGTEDTPIVTLGRDIQGIPVVFQGEENSCVSCSVTWVKMWYEKTGINLSWPYLAQISGTTANGVAPSKVLEAARKQGICLWDDFNTEQAPISAAEHRIDSYSYVHSLSPQNIYKALCKGPIAVGVNEVGGVKNHMVVAYDVTPDGQYLQCVNWWQQNVQDTVQIPFSSVTKVISFATIDSNINPTMPFLSVLKDKVVSFLREKPLIALLAVVLGASLISGGTEAPKEQQFGQSGVALGYTTTIAAPGISSSIRSIPVSSITLYTGETISTSTLIFPAYFTINPNGSTQELVECWGLTTTTTSPTWTDCNRGMSALGGASTSTVSGAAYSHAAGERFVMTNAPPFFNRFVDIYTNQSVTGTKHFTADSIKIGSGTVAGGQKINFHSSQASDAYFRVLSNGATSTFYISFDGVSESLLNASGTVVSAGDGLSLAGGVIDFNASTTRGISIDSSNFVYLNASTTDIGGVFSFNAQGMLVLNPSNLFLATTTIPGYMDWTNTSTMALLAGTGFFGDGSDGDVTISANATLTRDMFYNSLTVNTGTQLCACGYRIFARRYIQNDGVIQNWGFAAPSGTGVGGLGANTGTMVGGLAGSPGGAGGNITYGATGTAGIVNEFSFANTTGAQGGLGGGASGGSGTFFGGGRGTSGTNSGVVTNIPRSHTAAYNLVEYSATNTVFRIRLAPGAAGGGGGAGTASTPGTIGGNGGGGGGGGGFMFISTPVLVNNWRINADGGAGGTGGGYTIGGGSNRVAGGGGGGGGGAGGVIFLTYWKLLNSGFISASGGAAGAFSYGTAPGAGGENGTNGNVGIDGKVIYIRTRSDN